MAKASLTSRAGVTRPQTFLQQSGDQAQEVMGKVPLCIPMVMGTF